MFGKIEKVVILGLILLVGTGLPAGASIGSHKADDLRRKMAEISGLQEKMALKIEAAVRLRAELIAKKRALIDEIRDEHEKQTLKSYKVAVQNPRVRFNLLLVQRIGIYSAKLTDRIAFFKKGNARLGYVFRQAEDDLKMIQTLDDMLVDELMSRVNRLLTDYQIEIEKKLISVRQVTPESDRDIYNDIMAGRL